MPLWVILVLLGTVLVGAALIALGRRGRRVNDHPQCTWCGFDLIGVYPGGVTCPECGAGLARKHGPATVRMGVRVRRPVMIGVGVVGVLLPMLPLGLIGYAALTGTAVAKHLPIGGLELMATHGTQARADEAAVELTDRLLKKSLDAPGITRAVDLVLRYQGDAERPWTRAWADLLERVQLNGVLTPEQDQLIVKQAVRPVVVARAKVARGKFAAVDIERGTARLATNQQLTAMVTVRDWRVEQAGSAAVMQPTTMPGRGFFGQVDQATMMRSSGQGYWQLSGPVSNNQNAMMWAGSPWDKRPVQTGTPLRKDTPLGPAVLRMELDITDQRKAMQSGRTMWRSGRRAPSAADVKPGTLTLAVPVTVVEDGDQVVEARVLEGEELAKFSAAVKPEKVIVSVQDMYVTTDSTGNATYTSGTAPNTNPKAKRTIQVTMMLDAAQDQWMPGRKSAGREIPEGAAFEVEILVDEQKVKAGTIQPRGEDEFGYSNWWSSEDEPVRVPKSRKATVRLKPSRGLAESRIRTTWFHNAVIEFKDVAVEVSDHRNEKLEPLEGLKDTRQSESVSRFITSPPIDKPKPDGLETSPKPDDDEPAENP